MPTIERSACIIQKLIKSTQFFVDNGVVHRDIKLSNILFPLGDNRPSSARLTDFGMASKIHLDGKLQGRCGTPGYVAPEILTADVNEPYGMNVDIFSIGVVSYILLCGYEPFEGSSPTSLIRSNKRCLWDFHQTEWMKVIIIF